MRPLETDLSIYRKFNFEKPPVGVKFLYRKPEGIERLDKNLPLCAMLKEAQPRSSPFYMDKDNEDCFGKVPLGMDLPLENMLPYAESGEVGPKFECYLDARANRRIYERLPRLGKGTVNYLVFSPIEKLTFEPDLLVFQTTVKQAEIILRAMSYSTGEIWEPKATHVLSCAWLYVYPFKSGKVNYTITGLAFGSKSRRIFQEGWMLISVPWDWIPIITQTLKIMDWVPGPFSDSEEQYFARFNRIAEEVTRECQNP
jgi:uncharacterized protein (DUF169 family)